MNDRGANQNVPSQHQQHDACSVAKIITRAFGHLSWAGSVIATFSSWTKHDECQAGTARLAWRWCLLRDDAHLSVHQWEPCSSPAAEVNRQWPLHLFLKQKQPSLLSGWLTFPCLKKGPLVKLPESCTNFFGHSKGSAQLRRLLPTSQSPKSGCLTAAVHTGRERLFEMPSPRK